MNNESEINDMVRVASIEEGGGHNFKVALYIKSHRPFNDNDHRTFMDAVETVRELFHKETNLMDVKQIADKEQTRREIIALFDQPIFVEETPNEYCDRSCCVNKPWYIVTTKVGRIKIGWRKSVINIDWSDSINKQVGKVLFPNIGNVTVGDYYVHAWGYEKAREYLDVILNFKECVK